MKKTIQQIFESFKDCLYRNHRSQNDGKNGTLWDNLMRFIRMKHSTKTIVDSGLNFETHLLQKVEKRRAILDQVPILS